MSKFILVLSAVAMLSGALVACAPAPCPGGGTWCQNQPPSGGDGQGVKAPVKH